MNAIETPLQGCYILEPNIFEDDRGYFFESFNANKFNSAIGQEVFFVQDNQSFSNKGVIRAIHYQIGEYAQAKLVRVLSGAVLDVAVDLRKESPTFGQHFAIELSAENKKQLFIPKGFGHGFAVLSETAEFFYKCDNFYNKSSEGGIIYNDDSLNIDWQLSEELIKVSEKDLELPTLEKAKL
ncbi:dTDP-4-dehydrorhamnose 3,5-epimerase [Cellulophaga tyrosinoxydans]|uniref:dTDP-4-dehydrorhamnose 3,5-epimerase n=1 Tax=Cellulophaga tyrosinoxydans TaxID=504486 RepID=A0A1W1YQA5_9FLAO|nr:dTDP-4-dehydrorhamnose 3,5-epimerase [Cellulophaga tyrosinoxydans]SMC38333.1 dTDP-4-dehydrorhamnose 3,5-epimerase [Cellulophaga tyrosinoxydans]